MSTKKWFQEPFVVYAVGNVEAVVELLTGVPDSCPEKLGAQPCDTSSSADKRPKYSRRGAPFEGVVHQQDRQRGAILMSILIVEDNPVNAMLLENFLEKGGYHTVLARSAKDALASLPNISDLQLIITDLIMPDMDGLELIAHVRKKAAFKDLPIIAMSAQSDVETVTRATSLQCSDFLVKPVDKKQLLTRIESLLKEQSPVLQDKNRVMNNLGVGTEEYDDLIHAFVAQLDTAMPIVVLEQAESGEAISENLGRLLKELAESAIILGAERFSLLYSRLKEETSIIRSQCGAVLKSLQELETALRAHSKSR